MSEIMSYAQFARCLDINPAIIRVNVKRGNIIADSGKKQIDASNPGNKVWIDSQISKGKSWDLNRKNNIVTTVKKSSGKPKKKTERKEIIIINESDKLREAHRMRLSELDYQKKLEDLKEKQNANRLKQIDIEKKEGNLIPLDAVKTVFIFSIEEIRTIYLQELNATASIFVERLGATEKHYKEIQKDLSEKINDIMSKSKESLIKGVVEIVNEYKEVRSRGEKK